jgi:hypothetical protein
MIFLAVRSVGAASADSGYVILNGVPFVNQQTGYCLDSNNPLIPGISGLDAVDTDPCIGGRLSRQWALTYVGNGTVTLTNAQTGYCLDSNSLNPDDPATGRVYTDPCNSGTYQQWYVGTSATGAWFLQDAQTGLILDSNYSDPNNPAVGAVYTDPCNGGTYQQWGFLSNSTPQIPEVPIGVTGPTCS